jgi:hypothetical protein
LVYVQGLLSHLTLRLSLVGAAVLVGVGAAAVLWPGARSEVNVARAAAAQRGLAEASAGEPGTPWHLVETTYRSQADRILAADGRPIYAGSREGRCLSALPTPFDPLCLHHVWVVHLEAANATPVPSVGYVLIDAVTGRVIYRYLSAGA